MHRPQENAMQVDEELEAGWLELASNELMVVGEPRANPRPGSLVYQRRDDSMLFSATMLAQIAVTGARAFSTVDDPSETFVPIALPATSVSRRELWLWRSLTVATAALLFVFAAALDLLIAGGRLP
ncbi:MAG TPA: hypothetical protein VHB97_15335 [Polyangia bacterium]|nr:hypothetical protein [Polyangia bacterium]